MNSPETRPLRVIALGEFSAPVPPLAPRLAALGMETYRCADLQRLPMGPLAEKSILLTELNWLETLAPGAREELCGRAADAAGWIALTETRTRFKTQVDWLRHGVRHFFQRPLDAERLATLIEDIWDQIAGPPPRVILVDDDAVALNIYEGVLRTAGMEVLPTPDPLPLLEALDGFRPDLLVVDIEMPACRGPELATILRQRGRYASLPVIFLTATDDLADLLLAREATAEDFLKKPVPPQLFVTAVQARIRRWRMQMRSEALHLRQEAQSRLHLEQLRQVMDEHAIISVADSQGRITDVNDKFCKISGYQREELLGRNHRIVKSGLHSADFYAELWQTISAGRPWHGEMCNRRKDGQLYWVEATIIPILDRHGLPTHYISTRTDITALKRSEEALRASEERLRRSQAFANIGTWDWSIQSGELYWSERIAPLFGYASGELATSYDNFLKAVHPDDRQRVVDAVAACVERDEPYDIEHRVVWPDGTERWLLERGAVVRDAAGKPLHMLGVVQDIDDRKRAEIALAQSELRLREAQSLAHLGNWEADLVAGTLIWSDEIYRIFGHAPKDFIPSVEAFQAAVHPDDRALVAASERRARDTGIHDVVHRIVRPDGSIRYVHELARAECDASGRVIRLVGTVQDITERKEAEERLDLFRRVFDASTQCIGITDGEGHLLYQNPAHARALGLSDEEAIGRHFTTFIAPDKTGELAGQIMRSIGEGKTWVGQLPVQRKGAGEFISVSNIGSVCDDHGRIQYLFNIFFDFSEELARRAELAQAKEAAERANQAKSDFLSSMSHELRTPMNAIIGFAQVLEYDTSLNADQHDSVHEIIKAGRHLLDLINEVLDLAKIESGRIDLSFEPVALAGVIDDCLQLVQPLAAARDIAVSFEGTDVSVRADRTRLKQTLLNLVSNAVKYNRDRGSVTVTVSLAAEGRARICVADTGPGIAPESMVNLFQPFSRLGAEQTAIEGTGIGLTITRRLTELMGGAIGVDSQLGSGSTFWVEFPIEGGGAASGMTRQQALPLRSGDQEARTRVVLCIDDNPVNLKLVAQMLGRLEHINLVTAHNAELGIELALVHRPNLILLDINMPGLDGYQVLEIFKADARLCATPVVAITANAMPRDIERGRAAGFADYLTKPLDINIFLAAVARCLGDSPAEENP